MIPFLLILCFDQFLLTFSQWSQEFKSFGDKNKHIRPIWALGAGKSIKIEYNLTSKILKASGTIIPVNFESDKPKTPTKTWDGTDQNTGQTTGFHKGHLIALSLGGPNDAKNIVPQPGNWQANGAWRQLEKSIERYCLQCYGQSSPWIVTSIVKTRKNKYACNIDIAAFDFYKTTKTNVPRKYQGSIQCGTKKAIEFSIKQPLPQTGVYVWDGKERDKAIDNTLLRPLQS